MVDNLGLTPGTGATIAADDIGGVLYQRVKIAQGADGTGVDVSSAAPLHINMASSQGNVAAVSGSITASATNTPGTAVTASTTGQIVANVVSAGNATFTSRLSLRPPRRLRPSQPRQVRSSRPA
jgi:hypothetical protein